MSNPGIQPSGKKSWKKVAGIGAAGAVVVVAALALSQCGGEEQAPTPTETPDGPISPPADSASGWNPDARVYQYRAAENLPIRESASADAPILRFVARGSCVESRPGENGNANRQNGFAEVTASSTDGIGATDGWMELKNLSNGASYKIGGTRPTTTRRDGSGEAMRDDTGLAALLDARSDARSMAREGGAVVGSSSRRRRWRQNSYAAAKGR